MHPGDFGQWYYLIYLLPGGTALLLLLISALGGGARHNHIGAGHGHHGLHLGHGSHAHAHGHHVTPAVGGTHTPSVGRQILAFFGIGRIPSPFVWGSALLGWGLFGFWGTQFWQGVLHYPLLFFGPALAGAVIGGLATARLTTAAVSRLLPPEETYVLGTVDLCGQTGTAAFMVDEARGRVLVYDAHGTMHDVSARVAPGRPPIARGSKVLVTDYDPSRDQLIVEEIP